jgi:hypothetical protein
VFLDQAAAGVVGRSGGPLMTTRFYYRKALADGGKQMTLMEATNG